MAGINADDELINFDELDLSSLGASKRLSTIDDCTIFNTPAPLAASTVAPAERKNRNLYMATDHGSFLDNSTLSPPSDAESAGLMPVALNKLSGFAANPAEDENANGLDSDSTLKDLDHKPVATVRPSLEFLKGREMSLENRSSLGLLNFDAMGDLSSSLLQFETSPHKPASHSRGSLFNYSKGPLSAAKNNHLPGLSPQKTPVRQEEGVKGHAVFGSHSNEGTPRPILMNPGPVSKNNMQKTNGSRSDSRLDVYAGMVFGANKDTDDLDGSVVEVELNEDELKQFDETFSDIGEFEQTLTDDMIPQMSNGLMYKGLGQRGEASGHYSDDDDDDDDDDHLSNRSGEGQEDETTRLGRFQLNGRDLLQHLKPHPKLGEIRSQPSGDWSTSSESVAEQDVGARVAQDEGSPQNQALQPPLDSIYLRRSPQSHEEGDGQEEQDRDATPTSHFLEETQPGNDRGLPSMLFRGRGSHLADESEIDTDDEIAAVRLENAERDRWLQEAGSHDSLEWSSRRPGLEGVGSEDADRLQHMLETRQSAEGDVMTSPVPGDGGGGGDGSSGHSSEDDSGHGGSIQGMSQTTMEVLQGLGFVGRGSQQFRPMRMQSDRFQEDNPEAQRRIRPMGDDLLSETNTRHVRFDLEVTRSRTLSGASATDADSILDDRDNLDQSEAFEPDARFLSSQFLVPSSGRSHDSSVDATGSGVILGLEQSTFNLGDLIQGPAAHAAAHGEDGSHIQQTTLFPDDTGVENYNADFTYSNNNVSLGLGLGGNEAQDRNPFQHDFADESLAFGGESLRFPEGHAPPSNFTFSNNDVSLGFGAMQVASSPPSDRPSDPLSERSSTASTRKKNDDPEGRQRLQSNGPQFGDETLMMSHLGDSPHQGTSHEQSSLTVDKTASFSKGTKMFLSDNSPVYMNEDGEVVTDLAYIQPLDELAPGPVNPFDDSEAALDFSLAANFSDAEFQMPDEFVPADNVSKLLDEDEAKFNEENIFTQDEVMEVESINLPDNWSYRDEDEAAAYMRISIGEFMRSKSEVLGSLHGDKRQPRPTFGSTKVATPPDGQPFSLLPSQSHQTPPILEDIPESYSRSEDVRGSGVGSDIDVGDHTLRPEEISEQTPQVGSSFEENSGAGARKKDEAPPIKADKEVDSKESSDSFSDISKMILASAESNPDDLVALILKTSTSSTVTKSRDKAGVTRSQSLDQMRPPEPRKDPHRGPAVSLDFRRPDGKPQNADRKVPPNLPRPDMVRPSDMPGQENMASVGNRKPFKASHDIAKDTGNHFQSNQDMTLSSLDTSTSSRGRVEGQADDLDSSRSRSRRSFSSKIPVLVHSRSHSVEDHLRPRSGSASDDSQKAAPNGAGQKLHSSLGQGQGQSKKYEDQLHKSGHLSGQKADMVQPSNSPSQPHSRTNTGRRDSSPNQIQSELGHGRKEGSVNQSQSNSNRGQYQSSPRSNQSKTTPPRRDNSPSRSQSKTDRSRNSPPVQRRISPSTPPKQSISSGRQSNGWKSPRPSSVMQSTAKEVASSTQRNILNELDEDKSEQKTGQSDTPLSSRVGQPIKASALSSGQPRSMSGEVDVKSKSESIERHERPPMRRPPDRARPDVITTQDSRRIPQRTNPEDLDDPLQYSLGDENMYRDVELLPSDGSFSNMSQDTVENAERTLTPDGHADRGNRSHQVSHVPDERGTNQKYSTSDTQQSTPVGKSSAASRQVHSYLAPSPELSRPLTSWQHSLAQQPSENQPPVPNFTNQSPTKTPFNKQSLQEGITQSNQSVPRGRTSGPITPPNVSRFESSFLYSPMTVERWPAASKTQPFEASRMSVSINESNITLTSPAKQTEVPPSTFIEAPSELRVPEICCVGVSTHAILPLHNPSTRWLHVSMTIKRLQVNGVAKDTEKLVPFVLKEKVIIEPGTTEHIQVIFAPQQAGAFVAELDILSSPILNQPSEIQRLPTVVTLQAVAESPNIELLSADNSVVNFGALPWGSQRCLPLHLVNHGRTQIPVRLQITLNNTTWHGFTFERSQSEGSSVISRSPRPGSLSLAPSVVNYTIPPATEGRAALKVVEIRFKASPHERATANGTAEEYTARVEALLDTPNTLDVLASTSLRASAGTAKLHVPRDTDVVEFNTQPGRSCQKTVILRNAGNIPLEVCLEVTHWPDLFTVIPCQTVIPTGTQKEILVRFEPKHTKATKFESLLLMFMSPDGPGYEMELLGHITTQAQNNTSLLSNRSNLVWGGVRLGQAGQQSVILKSTSSQVMKVRLQIKDNSEDFRLNNLTHSSPEIYLRPQEEYPVHVLFAPSKVAPCAGRLQVKNLHSNSKYMIPLTGYGGMSNVVMENLQRGHSKNVYAVQVGAVTLAVHNISQVRVSNHGDRSAYVRAVPFQELECKTRLSDMHLTIKPREFCLQPHQTKLVNVILSPTMAEVGLCQDRAAIVAAIAFCCGDELSRQQMRKSLLLRNRGTFELSEGNPLRGVQFDIPFVDEELVNENCPAKADISNIELFYTNMVISTVALVGSPPPPGTDIRLHTAPPNSLLMQPGTSSVDHVRLTKSLFPLVPSSEKSPEDRKSEPVAALFPTSPNATKIDDTLVETDIDWTVQPEHLMLHAPRKGGTPQVKRLQIINYSNRPLTYELSWPGHCITATPVHDTIQPRSSGTIILSASSSIHNEKIALPWSGRIYLTCGQSRKVIKVQIHDELSHDESVVMGSGKPSLSLASAPETSFLSITTNAPPSQNIKPMKESLEFNSTQIGLKSEVPLVISNTSGEEVKFVISSFAPAYVKVDGSSEVYRATYSAFTVLDKAGILHPKETIKVPVAFWPRQCGQFSQCWEIRSQLPASTSSSTQTCKMYFTGQGISDSSSTSVSSSSLTPSTMVSALTTASSRPPKKKIYFMVDKVEFETTDPGVARTGMIKICNKDYCDHEVRLVPPVAPFSCRTTKTVTIRPRHYVRVNLFFLPMEPGHFTQPLQCTTDLDTTLTATLLGNCS